MWTGLLSKNSPLVDVAILMGIGLLAMQMYREYQEIQLNKKRLQATNQPIGRNFTARKSPLV